MIDVGLALDEKCDFGITQLHKLISELLPTLLQRRLQGDGGSIVTRRVYDTAMLRYTTATVKPVSCYIAVDNRTAGTG
jgi:hypothetical protein